MPITNIGATGISFTSFVAGASLTSSSAGVKVPDLVGNLRVDQAWGSAQVAGALHNDSATYYSSAVGYTAHPGDSVGGAALAAIKVNLPMLGKGDTVGVSAAYCDGAVGYCSNQNGVNNGAGFGIIHGSTVGVGWLNDAYYNSTTLGGLELSKAWNVNGGIEHHWNDKWRTSLWGAYFDYEANSNAVDTIICPALSPANTAGCTDYSAWQAGSRTVWNPVVNMDVSLEVMYTHVDTAMSGTRFNGVNGTPALLTAGDTGIWSGVLRFQRNFWP
jgi:hypothetical protein